MVGPIYKILIFLKRRPGMSVAEFRDYYENVHARLGEKYSGSGLVRYQRRYVEALAVQGTPDSDQLPCDVITELWFKDRAVFEGMKAFTAKGQLPSDVLEDELRLFDRAQTRYMTVVEHDSWPGERYA